MMIRRTMAAAITIGALFSVCLGFSYAQVASFKKASTQNNRTKCCLTGP
jgi:hypothetical protein